MALLPPSALALQAPTDQAIEATAPERGRKMSLEDNHVGIRERAWGLNARVDDSVTFEEYRYWAKIERQLEDEEEKKYQAERGPRSFKTIIMGRFSKGVHHENAKKAEKDRQQRELQGGLDEAPAHREKSALATSGEVSPSPPNTVAVTDAEWRTAARALRTASWGTIFFLVTTDILGWSGAPFVFASTGYGAGTALYVIFGIFAGFSGYAIWRTYIGLDSSRFPMLSFGDPYFRVYGRTARNIINVTQSLQQFLTVAVLILGQSLILAQIAKEKICFVVCMVIIMVVGMISGSIRSLQRLGWLCNVSVWLNVVSFIIIMYACVNNPIDYQAATAGTLLPKHHHEKVVTFAGRPPSKYQQQAPGFASQFNAVDTMIYAYSGALLFVAFLAEMRHPWDFWKGIFCAQIFICVVYIFFGAFVYSFWGQYSASNIGQVVQPYSLQTVGNVLGLITGFIAVFLYFNIGMKTVYLEVFQELLHFPPITTKKGKYMWYALGPVYWILAFVVAGAVPNLNGIVGFVGGLLSVNFTYTLPGLVYVGYIAKCAAELPGEGFDPVTGVTTRHDNGVKRYARGFFKAWYITVPTALYVMAGFATSGMGTWAAIEGLIAVFGPGGTVATSFGCPVPV